MKRFLSFAIAFLSATITFAQTGAEIVDRMNQRLSDRKADGIAMSVDVKIPIVGTVTTKTYSLGKKTRLEIESSKINTITFIDDTLQWTYVPGSSEVLLTNIRPGNANASGNPGMDAGMFDDIPEGYDITIKSQNSVKWELQCKRKKSNKDDVTSEILSKIKSAKRPVIFAGTAIRLADSQKRFLELADKLQIPVVTAWNAHDVMPDTNPYYCGRPGTVGTRGGNFVVQNSDLIFVIGSRLNIRLISYNKHQWAKDAYKIVVDIDPAELNKPTVNVDLKVNADLREVIDDILKTPYEPSAAHKEWLDWCRDIDACYPACLPSYADEKTPVNPYVFIDKFSSILAPDDKVICGNGSACVVTFQGMHIKENTRLFTNSGCASMGYGFPAAVGCAVADKDKRTICIDGDGSFQMNIQEMQTVIYNRLNLKTFILNNNGYHSIRQTQTAKFDPPLVGVCDGNGLSFPDLEKLAYAYGMRYVKIENTDEIESKTREALEGSDPVLCEVILSDKQNFEPKLSSKVLPDGSIVSPPIEDMFPFLPREEFEAIAASVPGKD